MHEQPIIPLVNNRAYPGYIHRGFEYTDVNCLLRRLPYLHIANVNPDIPHFRLRKHIVKGLIANGITCDNEDYP